MVRKASNLPAPPKRRRQRDREPPKCCRRTSALLPWATLGIPGLDGWSHRLRYAVAAKIRVGHPPHRRRRKANLADGDIDIKTRNLDGTELFLTTDGGRTPVVILPTAPTASAPPTRTATPSPPCPGSDRSPQRQPRRWLFTPARRPKTPAPGGAFDDRVSWLSPNLIAHRLISAGTLP